VASTPIALIFSLLGLIGWVGFILIVGSSIAAAWFLGTGRAPWNTLIAPGGSWLRWTLWVLSTRVISLTLAISFGSGWWLGALLGLALHAGMLWLNVAAVKRYPPSGAQVP